MRCVIARVNSFVLQGIDAVHCEVEVDLSATGLPKTTIVGLPDAAVRESIERVRTALLNSGYRFPQRRLTINLAPADVRKEGPVYDLPIALALLLADGTIEPSSNGAPKPEQVYVAGELALDGRVRPIRGGISLGMMARQHGAEAIIVPESNAQEAAAVEGLSVLGVRTLSDVVMLLNGQTKVTPQAPIDADEALHRVIAPLDFADIKGQEAAKRAVMIAAAGGHNILLIGPAGTGKTMLARALPGILPPLTREEALEVTRIYSSVGKVPPETPLIMTRPVRSPHHTASSPAIIGGGSIPKPGEVSLAHRGVLFLDEMPEFNRAVLETLRQPLEDGCVTIARAHGSIEFPARFMLVGALNPTPKGDMANDETSRRAMERYLSRLSGPLIDRVDIHIEVPAVPFRQLTQAARGSDSATLRQSVLDARRTQRARQGSPANGEMGGKMLDQHAPMEPAARTLLEQAMHELSLSARAYDKIRRVARTLADLEQCELIDVPHIAEAVQYRLLDRLV